MEDCIIISDDEDVEILDTIINVEPIVIDLTESEVRVPPSQKPSTTPPPPCHPQFPPNEEFIRQPSPTNTQNGSESQSPIGPQPNIDQQSQPKPESVPPASPREDVSSEKPRSPAPNHASPQYERSDNKQQSEAVTNTQSTQQRLKPVISDRELMISMKTLGNEKFRHNLFDDAVKVYKRAFELARKIDDKEMSAILHFNLAMSYFKLRLYDQAADECAEAVKIDDSYLKAHRLRGEIYEQQTKFEEAVICYEHLHDKDKQNRDFAILLNRAREKSLNQVKRRDWYYYSHLLGLGSESTREDLKKAFRKQALTHHPDRHSGSDIVTRKIQEKKFKDACEAHAFMQVRLGYNR